MLELKKSFAKKLGLIKKSRFLPRNVRLDLYFKIILPSMTYGLILWGSCCNSDLFQSLERQRAQWPTLSIYYKLAIFICLHKAFHGRLPVTLIDLISKKQATIHSTRNCASLIVPRFNTCYMKDSLAVRGPILWNVVTINKKGYLSIYLEVTVTSPLSSHVSFCICLACVTFSIRFALLSLDLKDTPISISTSRSSITVKSLGSPALIGHEKPRGDPDSENSITLF